MTNTESTGLCLGCLLYNVTKDPFHSNPLNDLTVVALQLCKDFHSDITHFQIRPVTDTNEQKIGSDDILAKPLFTDRLFPPFTQSKEPSTGY